MMLGMEPQAARAAELGPRTRAMLDAPIVPLLLRMAWPNVLVMLAQAATGIIETWWVAKLGNDALAGMALVFPGFMMMQMLSAGALGGAISSAVARAIGAGRRDDADALVVHALVINVALATVFVVGAFQGPDAVAGYGTGARLEYLLIPLVFGLGAPLVALVGTNVGAGNGTRALRIAFTGGAIAFVMTEAIGLAAAFHPRAWLGLFGHDPAMLATGSAYLAAVGPFYGFFGLGLALYFASQGAGKLAWPLLAGFLRMLIAVGGGYLVLRVTGSAAWLFGAVAAGMLLYGIMVTAAVGSGSWFRGAPRYGVPKNSRSASYVSSGASSGMK